MERNTRVRGGPWTAVLLLSLLVAVGGACDGDDPPGDDGGDAVTVSEAHFPQSVASGSPRPDGVVLWTRLAGEGLEGDAALTLRVASDPELAQVVETLTVTARAAHDHVAKVKVTGLEPATHYWYRFEYDAPDGRVATRTGRTKTAPAAEAEVPVRFAYLNCQDFIGRWYDVHAHLVKRYEDAAPEDDLDFVLYLGDYVYETTGDLAFQTPDDTRTVRFEDLEGAIALGTEAHPNYAAASLSNYRTLYRTYRSDPMLQRLHERYPVLAIWDDHEYSNDAWGATAAYFDGRVDETDVERRHNAEQAFFEYLPVEGGLGADGWLDVGEDDLYPNTRIYDTWRFGQHAELFLTDYRTYRDDHLIPEDAFPGAIVLDAAAAGEAAVEPYVDLSAAEHETLRAGLEVIVAAALREANPLLDEAAAAARAAEVTDGPVSARYVNALLEAAGQAPAFDAAALEALPRGLSWLNMGKQDLYAQVGSRYAVFQDAFVAYARARAEAAGAPETVYGEDQSAWLDAALTASTARWKLLASSVSFAPLIVDFTHPNISLLLGDTFPDELRVRLQLNADQWDGYPVAKQALLDRLSEVEGAVVLSGDVHASFVVDHGAREGRPGRVYEFTGPAASSTEFGAEVLTMAMTFGVEGIEALVPLLDDFLLASSRSSPASAPSVLEYANTQDHGYVVAEAGADALTATYHLTGSVAEPHYDLDFAALDARFRSQTFRVEGGTLTQP